MRTQCRRLSKHRDEGEKETKGTDDATDAESPNFDDGLETPDSEDLLSARPSISIEQGNFDSSNRDQSGISHDASASKSDNLEEDQSEISHVDTSASKSDNLEEEDKFETRPDASAEEEESRITHADASSVGSESSVAESSSEEETESLFNSAVEGNIETDPKHSKSGCLEGETPKLKRTTEDFTTWQRIIRLDAIRANAEWIIYSPAQAAVSEEKAQECASAVGLKDYDHLEPCRMYHAARLVAILEAYALYDQEIGYCQGMSDLLSPILAVMEEDDEAFWCFVGFMRKARHNFRLDEVGIRRQLNIVSKIIKSKDSHLYRHLEKLQAEDCFFVYRMVVVLFRRELDFEQTLCLWEVMWADQAAIRAGIGKSAWGRMRLRAPPTEDLLLYAIAACVLQRRKLIIESYSSMDEIIRECNNMAGHLDVWKLLDDAHDLVVTLHDKI